MTNRHTETIEQSVMNAIEGDAPPVLIIEAPVRHGKSQYISEMLTSWYLGTFPDRWVILTSATGRLAEKWGRRSRRVLEEYGHMFPVGISDTRKSASDWETNKGGGMITAGVGGDVMGRDGHLLIVDDYLKSADEAMSATIRDKQWDWWQSTFTTRLEPGGIIVVMATRWNRDDLIGRIVGESDTVSEEAQLPYTRITLRAIAEDDDILGRQPGEALWHERWPIGDPHELVRNAWGQRVVGLSMRKRITERYWWLAIYQQRPTVHGRAVWPPEYFQDIWTTT